MMGLSCRQAARHPRLLADLRGLKRDPNVILELWPPPEATLEAVHRQDDAWSGRARLSSSVRASEALCNHECWARPGYPSRGSPSHDDHCSQVDKRPPGR